MFDTSNTKGLKKNIFIYWVSITLCLLSSMDDWYDSMRYIKYLILPVGVLGWFALNGAYRLYNLSTIKPFVLIIAISLIMGAITGEADLQTLFMLATYIAPFAFFRVPSINILLLNLMTAFVYVILNFNELVFDFSVDIRESYSSAENSIFGFVFGFFILHFLYQKNWLYVAINVLLLVAAGKRSAVGAIALLTILWIFFPKERFIYVFNAWVMILLNLAVVLLLVLFTMGVFDEQIKYITGKSPNGFSYGRQVMYKPFVEEIIDSPEEFIIYGQGWGASKDALIGDYAKKKEIRNVHSDLLRVIYELGFITFCIFIYFLYSKGNEKQRLYTMYVNIVFITDNIMIYIVVMFIYLLMYKNEEIIEQKLPSRKVIKTNIPTNRKDFLKIR